MAEPLDEGPLGQESSDPPVDPFVDPPVGGTSQEVPPNSPQEPTSQEIPPDEPSKIYFRLPYLVDDVRDLAKGSGTYGGLADAIVSKARHVFVTPKGFQGGLDFSSTADLLNSLSGSSDDSNVVADWEFNTESKYYPWFLKEKGIPSRKYITKVKVEKPSDLDPKSKKITLDVLVSCSCPFFRFWGPWYNSHLRYMHPDAGGFLYQPSTFGVRAVDVTPELRAPRVYDRFRRRVLEHKGGPIPTSADPYRTRVQIKGGKGEQLWVCKHILKVLTNIFGRWDDSDEAKKTRIIRALFDHPSQNFVGAVMRSLEPPSPPTPPPVAPLEEVEPEVRVEDVEKVEEPPVPEPPVPEPPPVGVSSPGVSLEDLRQRTQEVDLSDLFGEEETLVSPEPSVSTPISSTPPPEKEISLDKSVLEQPLPVEVQPSPIVEQPLTRPQEPEKVIPEPIPGEFSPPISPEPAQKPLLETKLEPPSPTADVNPLVEEKNKWVFD